MDFRPYTVDDSPAIATLFHAVFTQAAGEQEGTLVGTLARDLMASTNGQDLYGFVAVEGAQLLGAIFFSRLTFEPDINGFILAPVAVHNDHQGQGIGQGLINHGLQALGQRGVQLVITYGDPNFYSKVGFQPLSQDLIAAPHPLSQPHGWQGQSLTDAPLDKIPGPCSCVQALDNPSYW